MTTMPREQKMLILKERKRTSELFDKCRHVTLITCKWRQQNVKIPPNQVIIYRSAEHCSQLRPLKSLAFFDFAVSRSEVNPVRELAKYIGYSFRE